MVAAGDERDPALGDLDVDLVDAHALLVGHRPELGDVAEAIMARNLQLRDAVLEIEGVAGLVQRVVIA